MSCILSIAKFYTCARFLLLMALVCGGPVPQVSKDDEYDDLGLVEGRQGKNGGKEGGNPKDYDYDDKKTTKEKATTKKTTVPTPQFTTYIWFNVSAVTPTPRWYCWKDNSYCHVDYRCCSKRCHHVRLMGVRQPYGFCDESKENGGTGPSPYSLPATNNWSNPTMTTTKGTTTQEEKERERDKKQEPK